MSPIAPTVDPYAASQPALVHPLIAATDDAVRPLVVASEELLQGRRELWIEHRGQMYRLRVTSAGKLYMTK